MKLTLRYLIFVDASLWSWRYATWSSLTLHYEVDATLLDLRWHFTMNLTLRYLIFVDTSLHVDGLSSLYVHSNLGLECVLDAYASYMQKMLDQLNPNKMFQNVDWLKPPALWEQKWKSSPTRTPGRVARRTQFFEKLNPKKSTIKMLVAEVKPCNHVVAWHIHLVKIHTSLQRKRNFEENNRLKEHDFSYQHVAELSIKFSIHIAPNIELSCRSPRNHLPHHHVLGAEESGIGEWCCTRSI